MKQMMRVAAMGIAGMMVLSAAAAVPYIESDGTQAINTGYFVNPKTKIEIDFAMTDLVTAQQRMFGCNNTANNAGLVLCQLYVNGSRGYSFALSENPLGSTWWTIRPDSVQIYVTAARRFFVLDAPNKLASLYTDGVLNASRETKTITQTATYPLTLFATCINADCTSFSDQKAGMRLYSFKIYENNSLVMELLPYREGTRYGLKDTISGNTFFPHVGNPLTGGNLGEEMDPDTVVIDPGYNVTTNGPQVLGAKNVQINTGADAGIVKMDPGNGYSGETRLMGGTLWTDNLQGVGVGSLGVSPTLVLGPGTFRYDGPDGGTWSGTITSRTTKAEAAVVDARHDFTLEGKWGWEAGGFVKTGPGTLTLKNTAGGYAEMARLGSAAIQTRLYYQTLDQPANGDTPTTGFSKLTVAEGKLVLGGGNWSFEKSETGESTPVSFYVGCKTVEPTNNVSDAQEKEAALQIDAGTVYFRGWMGIGFKNGFASNTPDFVPSSKLIVNGGTTHVTNQLVMGYNSDSIKETDANGNCIPYRTSPRVEIHGGSLRPWVKMRICDAPGADSTLFIDGGNLVVKDGNNKNGSYIVVANGLVGDATQPRRADITVCTNGYIDITDLYIANDRTNVTVNLNVLDGGRFRTNHMRLSNTAGRTKDCEMNLLVDGGLMEVRAAGYADWIKSDVTSARIGTHGAIFRTRGSSNAVEQVCVTFTSTNTWPDEVAQGVTIDAWGSTYGHSGFRFIVPQAWTGPTRICNYGLCEMGQTGAFPTATDLTLEPTAKLLLTNGLVHTVNSLTLDATGSNAQAAELWLSPGAKIQAGSFGVAGAPSLAVRLLTAAGAMTDQTAAGTYPILVGPASDAAHLSEIAARATWANAPAAGVAYSFGVATEGDVATLALTVTAVGQDEPGGLDTSLDLVVPTAAGETTTVTAADVDGKRSVTTNPTDAGGGTVVLGDSLAGFAGPLTAGSGLTTISDISFAAANPWWLILGPGTLHYTGPDATAAGLYINAGAGHAGVLRTDNDLTLLNVATGVGSIMKKGAGDLILKGSGTFDIGDQNNSAKGAYYTTDGVQANGDGPTTALKNLIVSEGRVVIGTVGDDTDAPTVKTGDFIIGHHSAVAPGALETAGELVMNNGTFNGGYLYHSFYCGLLSTTPPGGLEPKLTINGGTFNVTGVNMGHDGQSNQTASPTLTVNGGAFNCSGTFSMCHQGATSGVEQVSRIIVNGGTFWANNLNVGNNANSAPGEIYINDGGTFIVTNSFTLGKASTQKPQKLFLNAGGTLRTLGFVTHTTGETYIYLRGGLWQLGYNRPRSKSFSFGGEKEANWHTGVYLGAGGLTLDCATYWEKVPGGVDASALELRQAIMHDPDCAGEDGGIAVKGHVTGIFRSQMTVTNMFTGPVTASEGFRIGVDNGWRGFKENQIVLKPSAGLRASGTYMYINHITLGEENGTEPVVFDFCADREEIGVVVSNELAVLSPVTVSFHRPGGSSNTDGMQTGTYPVLIYPPELDDEGILAKFVPNANFPEYTMTYAKSDVAEGNWVGWKQITVTVSANAPTSGTTWLDGTTGGTWSDGTKWDGGVAPNGTNALPVFVAATAANVPVTLDGEVTAGRVTLQGGTAADGYAVSGGTINLNHTDFKTPPSILALTGTHTIDSDVTTDDDYYRSYETDANGGYSGAVALLAESNATLAVNGMVTTDPKRPLQVNKASEGGGTVKLSGGFAGGTGINIRSGTLEIDDLSPFAGQSLTIGTCTFHYSGPDAVSSLKVTASPVGNYTSIIRTDNNLTLTEKFDTTTGSLLKTGPGTLTFAPTTGPTVTNRIGYQGINTDWNKTGNGWYWPNNGDSLKTQGAGALSIDEGEVRLAGPNALFHISNNGTARDTFIGAQNRGWGYTTNHAALTILSGTVRAAWVFIGHTFNHGKDANGKLIPTYADYNQYGGNVTMSALGFCYDLSDFDTPCQATANLYGGTMTNVGVMRFGQTYNKTGVNPPHATFNIYGGTYVHTDTADTTGTRMGYLGSKANGEKTLNRSCDATLNMYGGLYDEIERIHMGCNATTSRINLHGGVIKAENIFLNTSTTDKYCYFAGGKAYIYWNGGTYAPVGTTAANQTLTGLTEVLISTNGAVVTTAELAGESYTIAQPLLHDPALEGTDGGFVKKGTKPLALTGANTYTGDTVVEEGTLEIPVGADASALPANSAVVVADGATLSMASNTAARVGGLRIDMGTTSGTLAGFAPAAQGTLYVDGVGDAARKGLVLPVTVTDAQQPSKLTRWAVYVDGDLDDSLSAFVRNNTIVLDGKQGLFIIVK